MKKEIGILLTILILTFSIVSCNENKSKDKMEWLTMETEYEGLPLYLRLPDYKNIWEYKSEYPKLINITHDFDSVKDNGLPTSEYNLSLIGFDEEVLNLFHPENNGIIFLVETFGGSRNYWFYIADSKFFFKIFEDLKSKHSEKKLELDYRNDPDWNFIKDYPVELYKTE